MFSTVGVVKEVAMEAPLVVMAETLLFIRLRHDWFTEPSKLRLDCDRLAIEKSEAAIKTKGHFKITIFQQCNIKTPFLLSCERRQQ